MINMPQKYGKMGLQRNYDFSIWALPCISSGATWGMICSFSLVPFVTSMISNQTALFFITPFTLFFHPSVFSFMQYFKVVLVFYQHSLGKPRLIVFRRAHWEALVENTASPPPGKINMWKTSKTLQTGKILNAHVLNVHVLNLPEVETV